MKTIFHTGDEKAYHHTVTSADVASFHGEMVHPVYSTFALARDAEWTSRQFVLEMCEEDEEGVGTMIHLEHKSPAFVGEHVQFIARIQALEGTELICTLNVTAGDRVVAVGVTGQKVLKKEKINRIFKPN